jgi:photolyase PhrII
MDSASDADSLLKALPEPLRERCRVLKPGACVRGEFVLYWMHHAVRGHENPALDTAIAISNQLRVPVLVYQGLSGNHPYNNDRHHRFILEGARDAHREIATRGVRAAFHLPLDPSAPSPLPRLVEKAAVFIVEDFPAPPFPRWTARLAEGCTAPVIAVDGSCLVPMQQQPRRFARAYEFRQHNQAEFARRLSAGWREAVAELAGFGGALPFDPLDLQQADFTTRVAECEIDHAVPPIPGTRGGSAAGYTRWQRFRDAGLSGYARHRNDAAAPWPQGVSRLSPYLHHGHVSPFRIAREAQQAGGAGAEKFLDELLVWRELAFNFCFHTPDPESLDALPDWARETLSAHVKDERSVLLDDETLARSRSGDELWDLAQTSLRIHGELHNNLRMTWAKAIPAWKPDASTALHTLVALNHRYALDGSDPNSYGGLLWTLGLFDRPFAERPVTGQVRTRSAQAHARRLDLAAYRARVTQPASGKPSRIAVVGAGIAGLAAARTLQDQGHRVEVFEKSRGPGGRAATRRYGEVGFDHGAPYFTARRPVFHDAVERWIDAGVVAPWPARMARVVDPRHPQPMPDREAYCVAVPGMNALGKHLAADLQVHLRRRVDTPGFDGRHWHLFSDEGEGLGEFDALVIAVPAPQAAPLLRQHAPLLADTAARIEYSPAWAAMLAVADDRPALYEGLFVDGGPIAWAGRNHAKPGRVGSTWVVHASPEWTRSHLEAPPDEVAARLAATLRDLLAVPDGAVTALGAHRWLYAQVENPLQEGALWQADSCLAVCGDWCRGRRLEDAYLSGIDAAGRLLGHLGQRAQTRPAQASPLQADLPLIDPGDARDAMPDGTDRR